MLGFILAIVLFLLVVCVLFPLMGAGAYVVFAAVRQVVRGIAAILRR